MSKDYSKQIIKDYECWNLGVHSNQGYLGRCVVWCKRENAADMSDATLEEQKELFVIIKELKIALTKAFSPDWFNYSFLGNEIPHLHGHIVPRYKTPVKFLETKFEDKLFGKHYKTDSHFLTTEVILLGVRDEMKKFI